MSKFKSSWIVAVVVLFMFGRFLEIRAFNCSNLEVEGIRFDFTELNRTFNITNTEESPPTMKYTTYLINPCSPLTYNNSVETHNENMCEDGAFICEIITHKSENVTLVTSVKTVAGNFTERPLDPQTVLGPSSKAEDLHGPLTVSLHGGIFVGQKQEANITFFCDEKEENITVKAYKDNILFIEWKTLHACGTKIPEESKGLGAFTKFLIFIFIIVALYLMIGAGYKYHVYRSRGWDLLPNRDFWRDVPYIASDLTKNLFNTIRGGRHPGYSRV